MSLPPSVPALVRSARVIVCAGSGGVGKTTTATALALAGAREGRRVLALTVDPSRRLAQTLGVERSLPEPTPVPAEVSRSAGVADPSLLEAWMLDPGVVADRFVHRFADSPEEARRLTQNRIYRQVSRMIAGMQEYAAMEALYGFLREDRYDLVVLDTPPSRHALDFLQGPSRLASFFDGRIFQLFLPGEQPGFVRRTASRVVHRVNTAIFGAEAYADLQEFFVAFTRIFLRLDQRASSGLEALSDPDEVAFVLVTSPASDAITDAAFFRRKCAELGLPFRGFVLNRSPAGDDARTMPPLDLFGEHPGPVEQSALGKLLELAGIERANLDRHREILADLERQGGAGTFALPLPSLPEGAEALSGLVTLADRLMRD